MSRRLIWSLALALSLVATGVGCGGNAKRKTAGARRVVKTPKLPPVKPEALREFDAALRALNLKGPEASTKALARFRSAVSIDDNLWEGHHNIGTILFADGDDEAAASAFSKALSVNPAHNPSLAARAEANRRAGKAKSARKDYKELIAREPDDRGHYARYASLLRERGDYEDGLDVLRDALRVAGASSAVYVELGMIYLAQGRDELAELVLGKAAALDAENPAIFNALALVALARGKDQLAFNRFDRATALDPGFLDARFNQASVLLDAGDYARAKDELDTVTQKEPDDHAAWVALGVAYRGMGDLDKARTLWTKVVKSAPRRSLERGDALFNLATLELDFHLEDEKGKKALERFMQESSKGHPKRKEAQQRRKELGP